MRHRACIAVLLLLSACAGSVPRPKGPAAGSPRLANLQRAAALPWRDGGRCAVREASQPWPVVAERCFKALDHERIRFHDPTGRCAVVSAGAAAVGIGLCVLAAPEIVVGAVIITGVVVVAVAIKEALDEYEPEEGHLEEVGPVSQTQLAQQESIGKRRPKPEPAGQDWFPPGPAEPSERERRPECTPRPVPHLGGDDLHNTCADRVPRNSFPGRDVLINGKHFDALQLATRTLWEVKTTAIETYNPYVREVELNKQVEEGRRERNLAAACGYDFRIGVRSETHKEMLEFEAPEFVGIVVVMDWC